MSKPLAVIGYSLLTFALIAVIAVARGNASYGVDTRAPYGGCKEVMQDFPAYVHTDGAADCRARGWIIRPRAVVGPLGHVYLMNLPACHYEDGSRPGDRQQRHCYWNAGTMGNRRGHSFILDQTRARIVVTYLGSKRHPGWSQYVEAGSVR